MSLSLWMLPQNTTNGDRWTSQAEREVEFNSSQPGIFFSPIKCFIYSYNFPVSLDILFVVNFFTYYFFPPTVYYKNFQTYIKGENNILVNIHIHTTWILPLTFSNPYFSVYLTIHPPLFAPNNPSYFCMHFKISCKHYIYYPPNTLTCTYVHIC